jgi:hypothetical protein
VGRVRMKGTTNEGKNEEGRVERRGEEREL